MQTKRAQAIKLLRKVEKLKAELRLLEPELNKACVAYGLAKASPTWGFRPIHLKIEMETQVELKGRKVA